MTVSESDTQLALEKIRSQQIDITDAIPMRLQSLDLARHTVIAPDNKRYVVATFDDKRLNRGYVTAAYLQQNNYLTLIRLPHYEVSSAKLEDAVKRHITTIHAVQHGKLATSHKKI